MNKYEDNTMVEPMDTIVLLNDNYIDKKLRAGYVGIVMDNYIKENGYVVVDFENPIDEKYNQPAIDIYKDDFRVISGSVEDQKLVKKFRDLFKK